MSIDDTLRQFQRMAEAPASVAPAPSRPPAARPGERVAYVPFHARDRVDAIDICAWRSGGMAFKIHYNYIPLAGYNCILDHNIVLTTPTLVVILWGSRLKPIVDAMGMSTCHFVHEYCPSRFLPPRNPDAPFVERIEFRVMHGLTPAPVPSANTERA